ncbi:MAG TPA: YhjD/YihY/BrkB family envelope integrity protein, partial [Pyrinomonadaceae bacterium]|nr:YhjD/YihY/BrkB family envelope integrity protein [Pyrinomonadaceae bacterium]
TYGSLGALIIMMLWFYFTGMAILFGGEVNSEIEDAAAKSGAQDKKSEKRASENKHKRSKGRKREHA